MQHSRPKRQPVASVWTHTDLCPQSKWCSEHWLAPVLRGKSQPILWPQLFLPAKLHWPFFSHKKLLVKGRRFLSPVTFLSGGPAHNSMALTAFARHGWVRLHPKNCSVSPDPAGLWISSNYFYSSSCCLFGPVQSCATLSVSVVDWPALIYQLESSLPKWGRDCRSGQARVVCAKWQDSGGEPDW